MFEAGQALTPDVLQRYLTRKLNRDYYGDEIVLDDNIAIEVGEDSPLSTGPSMYIRCLQGSPQLWRWPRAILGHGAPARERYIQFLSGGSLEVSNRPSGPCRGRYDFARSCPQGAGRL